MNSSPKDASRMDELIDTIADTVGLAPDQAREAVGIMLALVKSDGDQALVPELMAAMPGAAELADRHTEGSGSLLGALPGALGGGAIKAFASLTRAGLSTDQIKAVGKLLFEHAKVRAGEDLVRQVAGSIPGLSPYI